MLTTGEEAGAVSVVLVSASVDTCELLAGHNQCPTSVLDIVVRSLE